MHKLVLIFSSLTAYMQSNMITGDWTHTLKRIMTPYSLFKEAVFLLLLSEILKVIVYKDF